MSVDKFEILKKLDAFDKYLDVMTKSINYNLTHEKLDASAPASPLLYSSSTACGFM